MEVAIGLTFPGHLKDEAIICYLCKNFNVNLIIIEASFSMSAGWAILKIDGDEAEVNKVLKYLESKEIKVQQIETKTK